MTLRRKIGIAFGLVVVAGLGLPVSNLLVGGPEGAPLTRTKSDDAQLAGVAQILEKKCAWCHVPGTGRPFYARLPVAKGIIEKDVTEGLAATDLAAELFPAGGGPVTEPALARIEREITADDMPPAKFLYLHWDGKLAEHEEATVLAWTRDARAKQALPGVPDKLRGDVIRPLPATVAADARKVALGEKLYNDKRLSGDNTVSCASCHDLAKGGTDNAVVSTGIRGQKGGINAPTTFNSAFQVRQFWDGRAADLQEQAAGPPANPIEMGATWDGIVATLAADPATLAEFQAIYPDGVKKANVTDAIAEFERTLITPGSKLDKLLLGDASALSADEKKGYDVFVAKGCATCHVGELLGGRTFERMGRKADYFQARGKLTEADNGRFNFTKVEADKHKFKVPTLRNVERTAPYFHDGSQATLRDAVISMAKVQTGEPLGDTEAGAVVKFLEALTGEYKGKRL